MCRRTSRKNSRKTKIQVGKEVNEEPIRKTSRQTSRQVSKEISRKTSRKNSRKTSKRIKYDLLKDHINQYNPVEELDDEKEINNFDWETFFQKLDAEEAEEEKRGREEEERKEREKRELVNNHISRHYSKFSDIWKNRGYQDIFVKGLVQPGAVMWIKYEKYLVLLNHLIINDCDCDVLRMIFLNIYLIEIRTCMRCNVTQNDVIHNKPCFTCFLEDQRESIKSYICSDCVFFKSSYRCHQCHPDLYDYDDDCYGSNNYDEEDRYIRRELFLLGS